jgi:hypothetical protein
MMKIEPLLDVLKSTVNLPLTDSQKITLIKQLISGVEFRLEQDK